MNAAVTALAATAFAEENIWSQLQSGESSPPTVYNSEDYIRPRMPVTLPALDFQDDDVGSSVITTNYVTNTDYFASWTDSKYVMVSGHLHRYFADLSTYGQTQRVNKLEYKNRIDSLRLEAELDGFGLNEESFSDFWSYVGSVPYLQKASLVLMDNGNLRAVWKDSNGNRLGLQFLGDRSVESVVFKRRPSNRGFTRGAGFYTLEEFNKQIFALDLAPLLFKVP